MEPVTRDELKEELASFGGRLLQLNLDLEVWIDRRFAACEERMEKRFTLSEDRLLKALAGYVEATDRRFAGNERTLSDLANRQPPH
ncbi:MAG: hypothetical protein M3Z85_05905 [Acidobacteriota bacterium]|nr:hypothetical protein [Acidobacteriota bacterium]